jgi:hypothetical protein
MSSIHRQEKPRADVATTVTQQTRYRADARDRYDNATPRTVDIRRGHDVDPEGRYRRTDRGVTSRQFEPESADADPRSRKDNPNPRHLEDSRAGRAALTFFEREDYTRDSDSDSDSYTLAGGTSGVGRTPVRERFRGTVDRRRDAGYGETERDAGNARASTARRLVNGSKASTHIIRCLPIGLTVFLGSTAQARNRRGPHQRRRQE